jgi:hypothetical protein
LAKRQTIFPPERMIFRYRLPHFSLNQKPPKYITGSALRGLSL